MANKPQYIVKFEIRATKFKSEADAVFYMTVLGKLLIDARDRLKKDRPYVKAEMTGSVEKIKKLKGSD